MSPPDFGMKNIKVGSGDVIGRDNEEFLTFVSNLFVHDKRYIVDHTHSYDSSITCLVNLLSIGLLILTLYCSKCSLKSIA